MTTNDTTVKPAKDPLDGDFTWLQNKPASDLHELHAALVTELTGIEVTAKQVQAMLHMHGKIQASEANRKRAGYKPRTAESIRKGGETTVIHMDQRLAVVQDDGDEPEAEQKPVRKPRQRKTAPKADVVAEEAASQPEQDVAVAS